MILNPKGSPWTLKMTPYFFYNIIGTQLFLDMILQQFKCDFKTIFKPPRPLKSSKMHGWGIKNLKKRFSHLGSENDPEKLPKRAPTGLLNRFKTHPKRYLNPIHKYDEKLKPRIPNLGSKMDLQRHLEPSWAPKQKIHEKRGAEVGKINTCCADIVLEINKN